METFKRLRNNHVATFFNVQHEGTVVRGSCAAKSGLPIMHTTSQSALLVFALGCLTIQGCGPSLEEVRSYEAEEGDLLVRNGNTRIELTQTFKPGEPNGLFDGGVAVITQGEPNRRAEINAVCSMPDLPNWPQYDNIYGRWLETDEQPGEKGGDTDWQLLSFFDGKHMDKGGEKAPDWAKRLSENLCRKGDFQDK